MESHLLGYHSFMSMYKWGIYRVQNLLQFRLFCFTDATWWWTWGNCTFIYLQLFVCCRVPRNVEAKITQWIRFQYAEELSDAQVHWRTNNLHWTRKLINLSFLYWSKAGQACRPCQVVAMWLTLNGALCSPEAENPVWSIVAIWVQTFSGSVSAAWSLFPGRCAV